MVNWFVKHKSLVFFLALAYLLWSFRLLALPIFADEAIYIRWAQLIIDDWSRYAFFPLNDGKTPLYIWALVPWQWVFANQLWAGRFVSIISGLGLLVTAPQIARALKADSRTVFIQTCLFLFLPFWFFSHRLALIDSLLVFFLALSWWSGLLATNTQKLSWGVLSGVALGLALWTKIPAILGFPMVAMGIISPLLLPMLTKDTKQWRFACKMIVWVFVIALSLFATLKLHPAFGQLFSRGSDFLYPISELTWQRIWFNITHHTADFFIVFQNYLTLSGLFFIAGAVFMPKYRRQILWLLLVALAFATPIMLVGKVIYPRYLLPAALPLTLAIGFALGNWLSFVEKLPLGVKKIMLSLGLAIGLAHLISYSIAFMLYGWFNPNRLPLTQADKTQYLSEWSAGNGVFETVVQIQTVAQTQKILVLTEGYFGTLPDGLLVFLHQRAVHNIFIEGIGQPIYSIPEAMIKKAQDFDQVWLVVNSHRLHMQLSPTLLTAEYCRLSQDPCLQVWNITSLTHSPDNP